MTESIDTRTLMAEIEAEARARRVRGDIPLDLEAELDRKFERLVPRGSDRDFDSALQRSEERALFDYAPPLASARRGGSAAKKGLAKLSAWYVRFVGQQVTEFAVSITHAVRLLGERVESIEHQLGTNQASAVARVAASLSIETDPRWNAEITGMFKGETGRVLVARAGTGSLVRALVDAGVEAYGVEPGDPSRVEDVDPALQIRSEELFVHLHRIPDPELAGVVLIGSPDRMTVGGVYEVLEELWRVMLPDATLVVVTTDPEHWRRVRGGLAADLGPGHPLAPETWRQLLDSVGFDDIEVLDAEPEAIVQDVPGEDALVVAVNEQLRALEAALVAPPSHCIRARRSE
jgi:hypothetical protein